MLISGHFEGPEGKYPSHKTSSDSMREGQTHPVFKYRGKPRDRCSSWRRWFLRQDHTSPLWGVVHGPLQIHADTRGTGTGWRKAWQGTYPWRRACGRFYPHPENSEDATGKLILLLLTGWINMVACISRKYATDFNVNVKELSWLNNLHLGAWTGKYRSYIVSVKLFYQNYFPPFTWAYSFQMRMAMIMMMTMMMSCMEIFTMVVVL